MEFSTYASFGFPGGLHGQFDTVLLKRAVRRTLEISELWKVYAAAQEPPEEPVSPLLVVQMPNTPDDELLKMAFDTVRDEWPELKSESLAHVFGEHKTLEIGGHAVPHVSPETLQDRPWIRVVFAKEAITTGWDCPRAEVLMSVRPARDETHITQLLGRMVRAPLARRVFQSPLLFHLQDIDRVQRSLCHSTSCRHLAA